MPRIIRSPFPGMDPYLEAHWGDVHARLITYSSDALQEQLPADLRARCEERVFVDTSAGERRSIAPDVRVIERRRPVPESVDESLDESGGGTAVATQRETLVETVAEPYLIRRLFEEPTTERFIEIREAGGGRVVTVIEFLSPANTRPGPGRTLYRRKQDELRAGGVSSVEIDLLRSGRHTTAVPPELLPQADCTPYHACVCRAATPEQWEVYPLPLRSVLPTIKIPLRSHDADVRLDLQAVLNRAYAGGGYDDLDYTAELDPPLTADDAAWAAKLLRSSVEGPVPGEHKPSAAG